MSQIRFATPQIGYVFNPDLLTTTDGGRSWVRPDGSQLETLDVVGDVVYRVAYDHLGCPGPCQRVLQRAAVGSTHWQTLIARVDSPARNEQAQVLNSGDTVLLVMYGSLAAPVSAEAIIYRSTDAGHTWRRMPDPCTSGRSGEQDLIAAAAAPGGFFAGLCLPHGNGGGGFVVTSADAAKTWQAVGTIADGALSLIAAATPGHLAVATGDVYGSGPDTAKLLVSTDGGEHWSTAESDQQQVDGYVPAWLGFETAQVGRWISGPYTLWTTPDGGSHWTSNQFH